jgi:hypothetical protein
MIDRAMYGPWQVTKSTAENSWPYRSRHTGSRFGKRPISKP